LVSRIVEYNTKLQTQLFDYVCGIQFIYFFGKIKILYYIKTKKDSDSSLESRERAEMLTSPSHLQRATQQTRLWAK